MISINNEILIYVQNNIIPYYSSFDKAHNIEHVEKVIKNSVSIASEYKVNIDMIYVIAAYHDVGLKSGRDNHEKTSADFLLSDCNLKDWFSDAEISIMAEAVKDHRASNDYEPRSIYGKIISEADRDIEYKIILTRVIQYGLANFPHYTFEQHYLRSYEHIQNKYGENGYLKLWLDTEMNRRNLLEIRKAIISTEKFKVDFITIFNECIKNSL